MKMKFIAACVAACAAVPAVAAPLTGPFDTPDVTVYLSGASAPDNFLAGIAAGLFNGTQGAQWYGFVDNGAGTAQRAYFGEIKAGTDVPAGLVGKKVMLIKRSTGGSVFGVNPVARAEALAVLKVFTGTGGCSNTAVPAGFNYKCPVVGVDPGVGTQTGEEAVPDFGVSDVSPAMFKGPFNVEFGKSELDPSEVANLTVKGVNTLAMGLAVTNSIPDTTYFSKATYGAALSGLLTQWSQLGAAAPAAGDQIVVCRRVPGSGTQTSYNWFFNNFPCTTASIAGSGETTPARMADSASGIVSGSGTSADPFVIDPTAGFTVIENSGSGDVRNCLSKAAAGGTHTFKDEEGKSYSVNFGTGGYGAIGVLSVDSLGSTSNAANKWSFRAIDGAGMYYDSDSGSAIVPATTGTGVHPTKANLIDGKYEFASELTMQYRNDLTGLKKDFADLFIARAGAPAYNTTAWVAALPISYDPTTTANVAKATRNGNMCAPLQRTY